MRKMPTILKDGLVGLGIGAGAIIPGISGATIALVFGCFKKIVDAVKGLLSKLFLKNLLILLPFGIGVVLAVAGLVVPFQLAFEHCMFAIVCLFAAFIIGSFPGIVDNVKGQKVRPISIVVLSLAFLLAAAIGVVSVVAGFGQKIDELFAETPFYLYLILFGLGIICASGLTVPGFSASMLLLVVGFYDPILNLVHIEVIKNNPGRFFGILGSFAGGVVVGFFLFSFLMSFLLKKHPQSTHYAIIGFVGGSLVAIFINSRMFDYINGHGGLQLLDWILAPIFIIIGIVLAYLLVRYSRKTKQEEEKQDA